MSFQNIPIRSGDDLNSSTDINQLMENIRVLSGNGTLAPEKNLTELKDEASTLRNEHDTLKSDFDNKRTGAVVLGGFDYSAYANTHTGNYVGAIKKASTYTGKIYSLGMLLSSSPVGSKIKMAIYSDTGGQYPYQLLGKTEEFIVPSFTGLFETPIIMDLDEPVEVVRGNVYWVTFLSDQTLTIYSAHSTGRVSLGLYYSRSYSLEFEDTFPSGGTATHPFRLGGIA
jgi:hypothetical protein